MPSDEATVAASTLLACVPTALLLLCYHAPARADDYFDPAAVELSDPQQKTADLHYFAKSGGQQPGRYPVSVWVNNQQVSQETIEFVEDDGQLLPRLTTAQLAEYGVNVSAFATFNQLHDGEPLTRIGRFIPNASSKFDFTAQRLNLSIPQAAMNQQSQGYVDPARWDDGIPAAFVDYNLTGAQARQDGGDSRTSYLNLRSGVNLGSWRLRNIAAMQYDKTRRWRSQSTYLQRDIRALKSQLRMGDTYTNGDVFDSVQFRGVQLMSQEEMLPDSQRGFAPVIRGMAHSNAKVTVSQHGYVIYETFVAPGAFAINDLYPTAQSGDLEVTVTESDGSVRHFTQPFSAVPFMLRQGRIKYSASIGRYYSTQPQTRQPQFMQSTLFYGLPADITFYGGAQLADDYQAWSVGLGHGFGELGSLGADYTSAATRTPSGQRFRGNSARLQYQKSFSSTGTTLSLASYRYSSSRYYDFGEANALEGRYGISDNKRSREELSLSQSLGDMGSLSASAWTQTYWHSQGQDETVHVGFYSAWKGISWGVGYYFTQSTQNNKSDRSFSFNLNIPLGSQLADSSVSYSTTSDNNGYTSQQASLYGSALEKNNLYYTVQQGYGNKGQGSNSGVSLDYRGGYGETQLGYQHDNVNSQVTWGASGSIVAHPHGVTFGQYTGDSFAVVRAPGASNVDIQNGTDLHTDWRGYAIVPTLTAYRKNDISLDTESLPDDADVELQAQTVIPDGGAIVEADYHTHIGSRVLFTLRGAQGPLPFGASARLVGDDEAASGIVAEQGQVYLSGMPDEGIVEVSWMDSRVAKTCRARYHLPTTMQAKPVKTVSAQCL
ncbi:fimbria/pilus outer membrane usher protein [Kluyvera sichuanensis]|uniref:fimbria/pilus outer membrane usher protein n=1 Tax=Kluyvera sichuanensis TaxID=2725494 RepID=UPI0039F6631D